MASLLAAEYCRSGIADRSDGNWQLKTWWLTSEPMSFVDHASDGYLVRGGIVLQTSVDG
jgi:hypothetical protein